MFNFPPNCILGSNLISSSIHFIVRTTVNRINNLNRSLTPKSHCYWSCLKIRIRFVLGQFQKGFRVKNPMNGECKWFQLPNLLLMSMAGEDGERGNPHVSLPTEWIWRLAQELVAIICWLKFAFETSNYLNGRNRVSGFNGGNFNSKSFRFNLRICRRTWGVPRTITDTEFLIENSA